MSYYSDFIWFFRAASKIPNFANWKISVYSSFVRIFVFHHNRKQDWFPNLQRLCSCAVELYTVQRGQIPYVIKILILQNIFKPIFVVVKTIGTWKCITGNAIMYNLQSRTCGLEFINIKPPKVGVLN